MNLSPAERRVYLDLVMHGGTDEQMARRLGLSVHTVRMHMKAIRAQTGMSRTELVVAHYRGTCTMST